MKENKETTRQGIATTNEVIKKNIGYEIIENLKVYRGILENLSLKELKNKQVIEEINNLRLFVIDINKFLKIKMKGGLKQNEQR